MTSPTLRDAPRRSPVAAPQTRAAIAATAVLLAIIAVAAVLDPSGLLAPIGGRGLPFVGTAGVYQWAPLAVGLPVLLAGTVLPILVLGQRLKARWLFAATWVAVAGAGACASAATGFVSASPMLGAHLSVRSPRPSALESAQPLLPHGRTVALTLGLLVGLGGPTGWLLVGAQSASGVPVSTAVHALAVGGALAVAVAWLVWTDRTWANRARRARALAGADR